MRTTTALLCFSIIFSASVAAPSSPTDAYLAARDRYVAQIDASGDSDVRYQGDRRGLAALERQLGTILPGWKANGFPTKGRISLDTLDPRQLGYGLLDGLSFTNKNTTVVLTNLPLLEGWLRKNQRKPSGRTGIPLSPKAALRSEEFYAWAIEVDASTPFYGEIPVQDSLGADMALVHLMVVAQDVQLDAAPTEIVAAVVRGERVFIAEQTLMSPIVALPVCHKPLTATLKRAEDLPPEPASLAKVRKGPGAYAMLLGKADDEYRACFVKHLREQPHFKDIQRQAQALVEILH